MDEFNIEERVILDIIGPDLFYEISSRLGGSSVYISKRKWRQVRNEHIRQRFNEAIDTGHNCSQCQVYFDLAMDYSLSPRQIRDIIHERI